MQKPSLGEDDDDDTALGYLRLLQPGRNPIAAHKGPPPRRPGYLQKCPPWHRTYRLPSKGTKDKQVPPRYEKTGRSWEKATQDLDGANLQVGCTVLHTPPDNQKIDSLSKFRLTDFLNNAAPGMVTVVRVNKARNILAVDVKRPAFKAELLKVTKLCTVPVRAYLPREHSGSFGVLRDIDPDYSENDIKTQLQSSIGIVEVKRLGKTSLLVRVTFAGEQAPQHVKVGLVRTEVIPYRARPLQCYKCYKFGHIAAACTTESQLCHWCGKSHDGMCEGAPYCVNCEGDHASNAADCPVKERETEIIRYKLEHNTTFREAKGAVHAKRQVSKKMTAKNTHSPKNTINNVPPLTAEEFPLLKTPEGASDKSVDVAGLVHTSSEHVERKLALQNPGILGSIPTPARFDLDEHRTGVRSCITTAWCTLKTPG
ncbi:hypothetical protein HPB47_019050 [Ixodes persulcatus]|uniref:Uncharacterized protein n=1 Tax=Ixodes persulcatus TaxID=34615 RepID=A0AC60R002_IXOPE|nr:hypothetical protein HPB47_019050 [Ixodes persulcatus]